jgi:hypothetical protein
MSLWFLAKKSAIFDFTTESQGLSNCILCLHNYIRQYKKSKYPNYRGADIKMRIRLDRDDGVP